MRYPQLHYRWRWSLRSSPERLWPYVADTNRFNKETGLPAVQVASDSPGVNGRRNVGLSMMGVRVRWEEEPFEWVRPQRYGAVRRYKTGPMSDLRVLMTLEQRSDGVTLLTLESWVQPRNAFGLLVIPLFMRFARLRFSGAFRRYDNLAQLARPAGDDRPMVAASPSGHLAPGGLDRLEAFRRRLGEVASPVLVDRLCEAIRSIDDMSAGRVRPYVWADAWGVPRQEVLDLCLHATRLGLFDLRWDLMCPLCRGPQGGAETLEEVPRKVHCDACNIDLSKNFERSVELTFRVNPAIRRSDQRKYCVGGPEATPHVAAQQLMAAGGRRDLTVPLEPGRYRLRTLSLPGGRSLASSAGGAPEATVAASAAGWPTDELLISTKPTLRLLNDTDSEQLFILERQAWSDLAVTAAEVTCRQVFRDLFSQEVVRPGEEISVGSLTILFTDLRDSTRLYQDIGDAPAFGKVLDHFQVLRKVVAEENGAVVKNIGDAIMAVFPRPVNALRAILKGQEEIARSQGESRLLYVKAGMHVGPCLAVNLNDRLDYFGTTVNLAARLERFSNGADVILSDEVRRDPEVNDMLEIGANELVAERFEAPLKGFGEGGFVLWRVYPRTRGSG